MKCVKCGRSLDDDAILCPCGTPTPGAPPGIFKLQLMNIVTDEYRAYVGEKLSDVMINGLETGTVTVEQSKDISAFVLVHLPVVKTGDELAVFLSRLCMNWPIHTRAAALLRRDV